MIKNKKKWEGFYDIYKPSGPTSHDIIDKMREITGIDKIGHAGTLDPLAEGVLVVAVGRKFTKQLSNYKDAKKEYSVTLELGKKSSTIDLDGEIEKVSDFKSSKLKIEEELTNFKGTITQIPPRYSAVKIKGRRSYKLARKGQKPKLPPRRVTVYKIKLLKYEYPKVELKLTTGVGTYVRSIVRDLGENLSTGAVVTQLIRERVGDFNLEDSSTLEEIQKENPTI